MPFYIILECRLGHVTPTPPFGGLIVYLYLYLLLQTFSFSRVSPPLLKPLPASSCSTINPEDDFGSVSSSHSPVQPITYLLSSPCNGFSPLLLPVPLWRHLEFTYETSNWNATIPPSTWHSTEECKSMLFKGHIYSVHLLQMALLWSSLVLRHTPLHF